MKCSYYREKGYCSKGNDPVDKSDMGDCIYLNGEITDKASIHCSEGKKLLGIKDKQRHYTNIMCRRKFYENKM